jgi:hypothetical protein
LEGHTGTYYYYYYWPTTAAAGTAAVFGVLAHGWNKEYQKSQYPGRPCFSTPYETRTCLAWAEVDAALVGWSKDRGWISYSQFRSLVWWPSQSNPIQSTRGADKTDESGKGSSTVVVVVVAVVMLIL